MGRHNAERRKATKGAVLVTALSVSFFAYYVINSHVHWVSADTIPLIAFYTLLAAVLIYFMIAGTRWRSFKHLSIAPGRVLVIVPSYNEEPELLHNTVMALINQSRPPDLIVVIDDGSDEPVATFQHPLVKWMSQINQGKRHAQANVLKLYGPNEFDYVLTVDSDSVCDRDALAHMLRAMSNPRIQACTGMLLVRNWSDNFLTRLVDINVVSSCLMPRMARSAIGAVCPTSGALALYRAAVIYDNMDDYLTSGTVGDDRRLSLYALLRGEVVAVNEAIVETALPNTWKKTYKQRLRWSKSAWLAAPFVVTNLKMMPMLFYVYPLAFAAMFPFVLATVVTISIRYGSAVILYAVIYWAVVSLAETAIYAMYRPKMAAADRLTMWVLSLALPVLGILLRAALYSSLISLKTQSWDSRESEQLQLHESTAV